MDILIKKGDPVWLFNTSLSGKPFIEGRAEVVSIEMYFQSHGDDCIIECLVEFKDHATPVRRIVIPAAQDDPEAYLEKLLEAA